MTITTITNTAGVTLSSDATFRTWGSAISSAIAATGWVQTADSGQVNWTTVTIPTAGTFVYEIWRAADALQATDPIYLKIGYSRTSVNGPRIQVTAGTASDGAGTITSAANTNTSVTSARDVYDSTGTAASTVPSRSYVMGDTGCLVLFLTPLVNGAAAQGGLFAVERLRLIDGTTTTGGFQCVWVPGGAQTVTSCNTHVVYTNNTYAQPGASNTQGPGLAVQLGSSSFGADTGIRNNVVPVLPVMTGGYPELGAPSKWLVALYRTDLPLGHTFQISHYGETATFMACGGTWMSASSLQFSICAKAKLAPAVRIA